MKIKNEVYINFIIRRTYKDMMYLIWLNPNPEISFFFYDNVVYSYIYIYILFFKVEENRL